MIFGAGLRTKPAAFVERLDEAEDYLNQRLAANGKSWQVNARDTGNARLTAPIEFIVICKP